MEAFNKKDEKPDDDINISVDQTENLAVAIAKGLKYPELYEKGNVDYNNLMFFLEKLYKWGIYDKSTLGYASKDGTHGKL